MAGEWQVEQGSLPLFPPFSTPWRTLADGTELVVEGDNKRNAVHLN